MIKMTAAHNTVITCINSVFYVSRNDYIYQIKLNYMAGQWEVEHAGVVARVTNSLEDAMQWIIIQLDKKESNGL